MIYEKELRDFDMAIAFFERFLDEPNIDADAALKAQANSAVAKFIEMCLCQRSLNTLSLRWGPGGVAHWCDNSAGLTLGGVTWHNSQVFKDSRDAMATSKGSRKHKLSRQMF